MQQGEVYFELYSFPWKIYEDLNDIKENKEFDHVQILYMLRIIKLRMMQKKASML